jgi:hypothetical protein
MSKRGLVRRLLLEAGPRGVTTADFLQAGCGSRFGARVQELRDAGYVIDARPRGAGSWLYVLAEQSRPQSRHVAPDVDSVDALFEVAPARPLNAALTDWDAAA